MTIIKNHAKKLLAGLFALTIAFVMTGCSANPLLTAYEDALAEANVILEEAKGYVVIPNADNVVTSLALPDKVVREDWEVKVAWASSNPTVISNLGRVTRPSSNTNVTLTATFDYFYHYGGEDTSGAAVKITDTKVFTLTVIQASPAPTPISTVLAAEKATSPTSTIYSVEGLVVQVNAAGGFFVKDDTGVIAVYTQAIVHEGDYVRVSGHRWDYYLMPQLATKTDTGYSYTTSVMIISSGNPVVYTNSVVENVSLEEFHFADLNDPVIYSKLYRFFAKVTATGTGDSASYFLLDPITGRQADIYSGSSGALSLSAYVNKYVMISVLPYNFHTSNLRWRVMYANFNNSIYEVSAPTDQQYVDAAMEYAYGEVANSMMALQTIDLPESYGVGEDAIEFAYSLPAGELKASLSGNSLTAADINAAGTVSLTTTVTKGDISYSFTRTVSISTLANTLTVAEFKLLADNAIDFIKGDIVGIGGTSGGDFFWIKDTDGATIRVEDPVGTSVLGDKVILSAKKKTSGTEVYADEITLVGRVSQNNPLLPDPTGSLAYDYTTLNGLSADTTIIGKYVKVTAYVKNVNGFYNLYVDNVSTTTKLQSYNNTPAIAAELYNVESLQVDVIAFVHSFNSGNIRLSIQKIINSNPEVLVSSLSMRDMEIGVGEEQTLGASFVGGLLTFNGGVLPRPVNRAVTYAVAVEDQAIVSVVDNVLTGLTVGTATVTVTSTADSSKTDTFEVDVVNRELFTFATATGGNASYNDIKTITTPNQDAVSSSFVLTGVAYTSSSAGALTGYLLVMAPRVPQGTETYKPTTTIVTSTAINNLSNIGFDYAWWSSADAANNNKITEFKVYIATDAAFTENVLSFEVTHDTTAVARRFSQDVTTGNYYVKIVFSGTHTGGNNTRMMIDNLSFGN